MSKILSAASLMNTKNSRSGFIEKKLNDTYSSIFPCAKEYNRRFIILSGGYLYRFTDAENDHPKGIPIPIESITIHKIDEFTFELKTIRKHYIFRTYSAEECSQWIAAIVDRKRMAIKESMGHVDVSSTVNSNNKAAKQLYDHKMKREVEQANATMNPLNQPLYQ